MLARVWHRLRRSTEARGEEEGDGAVFGEIRRLELRTRGLVESLFSGEYASVFRGRGLEFSHVRRYQPGDDVRAIDWKVTARRGNPFVRQFVEERDLLVVLIVDVSASGRFAAGERSVSEVANEIVAALAFAAARNNDRIALLLVSDEVEYFLPPGSGRRHTVRLLADLLSHRPKRTGTRLASGLDRISRTLAARATVFVVSDFISGEPAAGGLRDGLLQLVRRHDVVAVRLLSPRAVELPNVGWIQTSDPETGQRVTIDTGSARVRAHYRHSALRAQAETAALLDEAGAELVDVDTRTDPIEALTHFFRLRRAAR